MPEEYVSLTSSIKKKLRRKLTKVASMFPRKTKEEENVDIQSFKADFRVK
jgi:hypothetical protein